MSKVYIEGMEMPKCCLDCKLSFVYRNKLRCMISMEKVDVFWEIKDKDCPLREENDDSN